MKEVVKIKLIEKITKKALKQFDNVELLDDDYQIKLLKDGIKNFPNSVIDFYTLELKQIELLLNISPITEENKKRATHTKIYDDWYEIVEALEEIEDNNRYNISSHTTVLGYEIYQDHYIKLYTKTNVSFS